MSVKKLLLLLIAAAPPTLAGQAGQTPQLVDIGGIRLDVVRTGAGAPAVVFEAGLGDPLSDWDRVWPAVAEFTTVVAYSRSGIGRSDPGPEEHTVRRAAAELHALLARLRIPPPYVLVGRSYGGILVRLYTSLYPADVAGLVLVDGSHEQQVNRWGMLDSTYPAAFRAFFDSLLGTLQPGAEAAEIRESMRIQAAAGIEGLSPLPDIPLAVLTSMQVPDSPSIVNQTTRGHEAWRAMHDEWFRRSRNAIHIVTSRSGHAIQDAEPQLVVDAIRFVLDRVRSR
ncbi:MAG TPA: alpha/beta hydrolase [Gemmatimonadales bacterium]